MEKYIIVEIDYSFLRRVKIIIINKKLAYLLSIIYRIPKNNGSYILKLNLH